jgi:hypothetical protein
MTEESALSRIHRLGQAKDVKTIRYRIRGSIEEVRYFIYKFRGYRLTSGQKVAAGAFSSEPQLGVMNVASRLQVRLLMSNKISVF